MFTAFARLADRSVRPVATSEELSKLWAADTTTVWVDLEDPTEEELRALSRVISVDEAALEDCLQGEQRPRIDEYPDHVFVVLYGAMGSEPDLEFTPRKLAIFCGHRFLVTVHRESLRSVRTIRERCVRRPEKVLGNGVDTLLYQIIDMIADGFVELAERYEDQLEALEDDLLQSEVDEHILRGVLSVRKELLELRRVASSQRELVNPLAEGEFDYVSESLGQQFRHVRDHLVKVVELIDAQRERLNGLRDHYHTAVAGRANEVMKTLTVFAAVLLPLSVIAGIYGMNLQVWPPPEHPASFWIVLAVMLAIAGGMLYYFRRQKWV